MDRRIWVTLVSALAVVAVFWGGHFVLRAGQQDGSVLKVGFVYDGDESTPYTDNFIKAQKEAEETYGERIETVVKSNVTEENGWTALEELVEEGCGLIFTTSFGFGTAAKKMAGEHPDIQFCQATSYDANEEPVYANYHNFMGEIYQGRYIAGMVAGMKLQEMIDSGEIAERAAKIGYVAAYPYPEVISGYTAFLLGARTAAPSATMTVRYTDTWSSYSLEKACAEQLIDDGCVVLSQHSDTIGPAVACEEAMGEKMVYHVGYNQSMIDVAPSTSLISTRINWNPYILGAVGAVLSEKPIERAVKGHVHGSQDIGAGFDAGWVQMLELNSIIAARGTKAKVKDATQAFRRGGQKVFYGDYIGVNPEDTSDTIDLNEGYTENQDTSAPMFQYVLEDVITIKE